MQQTIDEMRLVTAAKCGNRDAFGELIARHMKEIFNVARRITRNREDAEDAVQESFRSALVHVGSFDGRSRFSTWLTRIAINAALMKLRKNRGLREVPIEEPPVLGEAPPHHETKDAALNPEEAYAADERRRILREAVVELRPKLRDTINHQLREKSLQETAEILGISTPAVNARLLNAKTALRRAPQIKAICGSFGSEHRLSRI